MHFNSCQQVLFLNMKPLRHAVQMNASAQQANPRPHASMSSDASNRSEAYLLRRPAEEPLLQESSTRCHTDS